MIENLEKSTTYITVVVNQKSRWILGSGYRIFFEKTQVKIYTIVQHYYHKLIKIVL